MIKYVLARLFSFGKLQIATYGCTFVPEVKIVHLFTQPFYYFNFLFIRVSLPLKLDSKYDKNHTIHFCISNLKSIDNLSVEEHVRKSLEEEVSK
jgi:hypothetical protein